MSLEIAFVLALLVAATLAFAREWLSVDLVALLLVAALAVFGILTPEQALAGFASDIIVILASIFVLSGALVSSGASRWLGRGTDLLLRAGPRIAALRVMALSAALSAFLNNTNTTAALMPAVMRSTEKRGTSPSRLLMPLAFASMLGGTCTLVGTSTNIAASGMLVELGLEPIGLFELSAIGLLMVGLGLLYLSTAGMRLLPATAGASLAEPYALESFLAETSIAEGSALDGVRLADAALNQRGIQVVAIIREGQMRFPEPDRVLAAEDTLLVKASKESLVELYADDAIDLAPSTAPHPRPFDSEGEGIRLAEAIVMPRSRFIGRTVREIGFRRRFGASVLAIHRRGTVIPIAIVDQRLAFGDVLLLEAPDSGFADFERSENLRLLGAVESAPQRRRPALAVAALVFAIIAGSVGLLPLSIGFLLAAIVVVLGGCLTTEEAYAAIDWRVLILIGGMTAFGVAMQQTGAAGWLADVIAAHGAGLGPRAVLAGFVLLTMLLTQPMSNAAAVLVVLPVAIDTAHGLGVDPRSFAIAVTLAGSLSFITPLEPACLLVYGPGKYRFHDFVRVGAPLSAIAFVILVTVVPRWWPF